MPLVMSTALILLYDFVQLLLNLDPALPQRLSLLLAVWKNNLLTIRGMIHQVTIRRLFEVLGLTISGEETDP